MKQILITALLSFAILAGNAQIRIPMTNKGQSGFDYLYSYSTRIDIALMELEDRVKKLERKIGDLEFSLEQERIHRAFERSVDTPKIIVTGATTSWTSDTLWLKSTDTSIKFNHNYNHNYNEQHQHRHSN